jgi:AcrR family transcriptional regulator
MQVFARHGFRGTGIEKILQEAGICRMTLYNHFRSKDELIVAALRRRDEIFRNRLMKFVDARAADAVERLLAVFDFHAAWFAEKGFSGCMFINAAGEFADPDCQIRRVVAEHKRELARYLGELCVQAGLAEPESLAAQLAMLLEGATVVAHSVCQVEGAGDAVRAPGERAKQAARTLIDAARLSPPPSPGQ